MKILNLNGKWRFLLLIPLIILIAQSMYFRHVINAVQHDLLMEKYHETQVSVDVLGVMVEACPTMDCKACVIKTIHAVEYIDLLHQVYGAAYRIVDGEPVLLTQRFCEVSQLDPFDYPEFVRAINEYNYGQFKIYYQPSPGDTWRDLYMYFRWMPFDPTSEDRILAIIGVSRYSVVSEISSWVSAGIWISTIVTFLINAFLVGLLARLGHVYENRTGEKWRERRD